MVIILNYQEMKFSTGNQNEFNSNANVKHKNHKSEINTLSN